MLRGGIVGRPKLEGQRYKIHENQQREGDNGQSVLSELAPHKLPLGSHIVALFSSVLKEPPRPARSCSACFRCHLRPVFRSVCEDRSGLAGYPTAVFPPG